MTDFRAARLEALTARHAYDEALAGFRLAIAEHDTCFPVTQFEAAAVLGAAGARMSRALEALDEDNDVDGFHAAYAGTHSIAQLV